MWVLFCARTTRAYDMGELCESNKFKTLGILYLCIITHIMSIMLAKNEVMMNARGESNGIIKKSSNHFIFPRFNF